MDILIVENQRRGKEATLRALALSEILNSRCLFNQEIKAEIVESVLEAKKKLLSKSRIYAVIFLTNSLEATAKKLAAAHPATRVCLFSDRIPKKKELWIEREWLSPEFLQALVNTIER